MLQSPKDLRSQIPANGLPPSMFEGIHQGNRTGLMIHSGKCFILHPLAERYRINRRRRKINHVKNGRPRSGASDVSSKPLRTADETIGRHRLTGLLDQPAQRSLFAVTATSSFLDDQEQNVSALTRPAGTKNPQRSSSFQAIFGQKMSDGPQLTGESRSEHLKDTSGPRSARPHFRFRSESPADVTERCAGILPGNLKKSRESCLRASTSCSPSRRQSILLPPIPATRIGNILCLLKHIAGT